MQPLRLIRWFASPRFRLRGLLIAVAALCWFMHFVVAPGHQQRRALQRIEELRSEAAPPFESFTSVGSSNASSTKGAPLAARFSIWMRQAFGNTSAGDYVHVSLDYTPVSDGDLRLIAAIPQLRSLNLSFTDVTDNGLKHLTACSTLENLVLNGTKVTDAGVRRLRRIPGLRVVQLGETQITDASVPILSAWRLDELVILSTHVTSKGYQRLRNALPKCRIL